MSDEDSRSVLFHVEAENNQGSRDLQKGLLTFRAVAFYRYGEPDVVRLDVPIPNYARITGKPEIIESTHDLKLPIKNHGRAICIASYVRRQLKAMQMAADIAK